MEDGIYIKVFAVKGEQLINIKIMPIKEVSDLLVNALMDGVGKVIQPSEREDRVVEEKEPWRDKEIS
jgi:hypothetical protein